MLASILAFMRCPACLAAPLRQEGAGISCLACGKFYPERDGILDMVHEEVSEVLTPYQRIMQTPLVVRIYETVWRQLGYFLASSRLFREELNDVLRLHLEADSSRLLDLACGTGIFTRPLAAQGRGVTVGLDLSWPMLRRAQELLGRCEAGNIALIRGSAFRLPFAGGAFSSLNCCGALHLFDRPDLALAEIARVLQTGGHLSVQTTIRPARSGGFAYFLERFMRFGFFDEHELGEMLRSHGLAVLHQARHRISFTCLARRTSRDTG